MICGTRCTVLEGTRRRRGVPGPSPATSIIASSETAQGPFVLTLVGATIVGSMATVRHGVINCRARGVPRVALRRPERRAERRATRWGRFPFGSTVVMLFPQDVIAFQRIQYLPARSMGRPLAGSR